MTEIRQGRFEEWRSCDRNLVICTRSERRVIGIESVNGRLELARHAEARITGVKGVKRAYVEILHQLRLYLKG